MVGQVGELLAEALSTWPITSVSILLVISYIVYAQVAAKVNGKVHEGWRYALPSGHGVKCHSFLNKQGLNIQCYRYLSTATERRGAMIAVHGIGTHAHWEFTSHPGSKFEGGWIYALTTRGYDVHLLDLQGHGRSDAYGNLRCHVNKFDDFVDDVVQFHDMVQDFTGGEKCYIMGESLGGGIVARVAERLGNELAGVVLVAAMLSIEQVKAKPINRVLAPLSGMIASVVPQIPVAPKAKIKPGLEWITEELDQDPLAYRGLVRAGMGAEVLVEVDKTMEMAPQLTAPVLLIHNTLDTMTDPEGSKQFSEHIRAANADADCTLVLREFPTMWHALCIEPGQQEVAGIVLDWLDER